MPATTIYHNADQALKGLAQRFDHQSDTTESRVGSTREFLFQSFTIAKPLSRELINPERKASITAQIAESVWVLSGRNDVEWLTNYLPRAMEFSDDGKTWRGGYGPRLRGNVEQNELDPLSEVVKLLNADPGTRRAVISLYDNQRDLIESKDIPCNNWLHFIKRDGVLHLNVATRSNDLIWGWSGINQFEWSVLLEVVARLTNSAVGSITYNITSLHVYERHFDRLPHIVSGAPNLMDFSGAKRFPFHIVSGAPNLMNFSGAKRFPFRAGSEGLAQLDQDLEHWFAVEKILRTVNEPIDKKLVRIEKVSDLMLRSWLYVIAARWEENPANQTQLLDPIKGTRLHKAACLELDRLNKKRSQPGPVEAAEENALAKKFGAEIVQLHNEKHAAYGNSWCRRGEMLGIMANLARKVDRLGADGGGDTALDTDIDLAVYCAKYLTWLYDREKGDSSHEEPTSANNLLLKELQRPELHLRASTTPVRELEAEADRIFTELEKALENKSSNVVKDSLVRRLMRHALAAGFIRWQEKQTQADQRDTKLCNPDVRSGSWADHHGDER